MFKPNKMKLLMLLLLIWCHSTTSDARTLRKISTALKNYLHEGSISLDKDDNLIFEGIIVQEYMIPNDNDHILKVNTKYIADKNGYRSNYTAIKEEFEIVHRLAVPSLKSLAG